MGDKCSEEGSWHGGECCCNCKYQSNIMKHPWNNGEQMI